MRNIQQELRLPQPLRSYQWEGVNFLVNNSSCLLSDEMGLGKTVQVAVALEILFRQNLLNRALIIVPASLKLNWQLEILKWTNAPSVQRVQGDSRDRQAYYQLPINILLVSYDEIRIDAMEFVNNVEFDVVVADEAQRIKNPNSRTALACKIIKRQRSWALTGTPLENNLDDLISIYNFINLGQIHKALSKNEIHERIRPNFLRRKKSEVAKELPPIIEQEIPIVLEGQQRESYENILFGKYDNSRTYSYGDLLALITKLKQICNYDPGTGQSAKFDVLDDILEEHYCANKKLIIFSQYVDTLRWLSRKIHHIPHGIYSGELDQEERDIILNNFRQENGALVLLMSLKAGGVGLNLQEAQTVIMFDRWWNPALEDQAIQRAHRLGRKSPLHAIKFLTLDTVEEKILEIIQGKRILFEDYIDSADSAEIPRFNIETMKMILGIPTSTLTKEK